MAINHHARTALAAEKLVEGLAGDLRLDVPKSHIHCGNCRHGHGPAPPVGALGEILPDIFNLLRVAADEAGDHMFLEIGGDRQFAPVQGRVPDALDSFVRDDLESHEVPARVGDDAIGLFDFHGDPRGAVRRMSDPGPFSWHRERRVVSGPW